MVKVIFFGSTSDSVIVLEKLYQTSSVKFQAMLTPPARPTGRHQTLTPTPVETWAKEHNAPVLSFSSSPSRPYLFADENQLLDVLLPLKADLLITACFGQKIPLKLIQKARFGGLNVHPSLLPRWRGADPVPWAIVSGDRQTGVSVVTLAEKFDAGRIIGQKKVAVSQRDFSDPLRSKLFTIGAELLIAVLPDYLSGKLKGRPQSPSSAKTYKTSRSRKNVRGEIVAKEPYARRLVRQDGFIPWEIINKVIQGTSISLSTIQQYNNLTIVKASMDKLMKNPQGLPSVIDQAFHAFHPWPGLWTEINVSSIKRQASSKTKRRLKILACHLIPDTCNLMLDTVQLEGKKPVSFIQFKKAYLTAKT